MIKSFGQLIEERYPGLKAIIVRQGNTWTIEMVYQGELATTIRTDLGHMDDSHAVIEVHRIIQRWYRDITRTGVWASELHGMTKADNN